MESHEDHLLTQEHSHDSTWQPWKDTLLNHKRCLFVSYKSLYADTIQHRYFQFNIDSRPRTQTQQPVAIFRESPITHPHDTRVNSDWWPHWNTHWEIVIYPQPAKLQQICSSGSALHMQNYTIFASFELHCIIFNYKHIHECAFPWWKYQSPLFCSNIVR